MRGQTLVLFALTLLLLTVMVMMTLGIAARIHERQEQQIVADAAAYSQAVVTARTYNAVSSLNRVLVAQLASIAAAQSLLSWTGFYHGTLNQARDMLMELSNRSACGSGLFTSAMERIMTEDRRLIDIWEAPGPYGGVLGHDLKAANYIRRDLYRTALTVAAHQGEIHERMKKLILADSNTIADRIAAGARQASPWAAQAHELYAGPQAVTRQELQDAVVERQKRPRDMVQVVMATRGVESFSSAREWTGATNGISGAEYVARRINKVIDPSPLIVRVRHFGTSYFSTTGPTRSAGPGELEGYDGQLINRPLWEQYEDRIANAGENFKPTGAWAQDVGTFRFEWPGAPPGCDVPEPTEDSFGYLVTTHPEDMRDNHMWRRGNRGYGDYREWNDELGHVAWKHWPERRHTFLDDPGAGGVAIWPVFVDYDARRLDERHAVVNLHGQPKSMVNIRRDHGARTTPDPWELRFRFDFSRDQVAGQRIDLRDERAGFRRATAIATGLTYYHRGQPLGDSRDHGREPPNFLNPFWRATLVASDVDERYPDRGDDLIRTLNDLNEPEQARTLRLLRREGFEGLP